MLCFVIAAGGAVASLWGTHAAASGLLATEVARGRLFRREANSFFDLDMNPRKEYVVFEIPDDKMLPRELKKFAGKYIMSDAERRQFLMALDDFELDGPLWRGLDHDAVLKMRQKRFGNFSIRRVFGLQN